MLLNCTDHISFPPFLLDCICLSPALKILVANCQIQVLFGSGIVCSGAQGRAERSLKILWRLMASNCSWVFKASFFGFACCVPEKGATALVGGWEGGFDSAKRWPCACCHQYRLCLFCPYVFSWGSSSCSSACLIGAREARLNPVLLSKTAPPSARDISLPADLVPVLLLHLLT